MVLDGKQQADGLFTTVIAPHQVYGERDQLFVPNFLRTGAEGKLFIFGDGQSIVSLTHCDNVCWALILASTALRDEKYRQQIAGQFYFVTDDVTENIWDLMDGALHEYDPKMTPIIDRIRLNVVFLYLIAYIGTVYTWITG